MKCEICQTPINNYNYCPNCGNPLTKEIIEFKSQTLYKVHLDKEITGKSFIKVPLEEGKIYKRAFWLSNEDIIKADDIINDYKKLKYLNLLEKIEKLK